MNTKFKKYNTILVSAILFIFSFGNVSLLNAKDTDIYKINTKQNCYILLDNSGSMAFGVYEQSIDYGAMFDYLFTLKDSGSYKDYIYDTVNNSDYFYQNHEERRKIFLWQGKIGVTIANVNGVSTAFTGDAADPDYLWYLNSLVDTHTVIDSNGNLTDDGTGKQRLTIDANGHILLDGVILPLNRDIKLHEMQTLYDGSQVDTGFGGLLNAPGYYFSGYEGVAPGNLNPAESGDQNIYFFVTGNWVNMQSMYNLHYTTNNPAPAGASEGDPAWKYELFPQTASGWSELAHYMKYPASGQYANNLEESESMQTITHPGATQIQVHFTAFDVEGDGHSGSWNYDYVAIRDGAGNLIAKYDNDNKPTSGDGWSATINGDTVEIALSSDSYTTGSGYTIDKIRVSYNSGAYLMQDRMDVARDAILYVVDAFKGKMNWGYASFHYTSRGSGDGAQLGAVLNPTETDDQNRQAIITAVSNETPKYGTPLGEALQDVFEQGYWIHRNSLGNLSCRKNYIISVTDGFPSDDNDWNRISDTNSDPHLPFKDWDGDGWTEDPYQYATPPKDYYDDVGHWMYTHSWQDYDKKLITDPANSYENITTHDIAFGADQPFLKDAAGESGGKYIVAYNKEQLVAAFYALALQMTEAVSFTSPVVSIDAANKIQNGDNLYLGLFLPQDNQSWIGNLKKFQFGDGSTQRPDIWMIYDGADNPAINSSGEFLDNTAAFWDDDNDANDSDNYGSADVREDGVGSVLTKRVAKDFSSGKFWERPIYTYNSTLSSLLKIKWDTVDMTSSLGVADDLTRDKTINFLYGYTYDANAVNHEPVAVRDWALGSIVHSKPVVIDYYDPKNFNSLEKRYIVVGANDGMLHVFDDTSSSDADYGKEVFAFVPEDILSKLNDVAQKPFVDTVDGQIVLYRSNKEPKYLIFGEREGGGKYWCFDISDKDPLKWKVAWNYTNSEIAQTWSKLITATIPVSVDATTGERIFKNVLVFTAGYDPKEDDFPEPFDDLDNSGSPYNSTGTAIDVSEWDKNNAAQDVNNNKTYDIYNPDKDDFGRGIYVVDIDKPANVIKDSSGNQILPFSAVYGAADTTDTNGAIQTLSSMKFCFPASPAVVSTSFSYLYDDGSGKYVEGRQSNVITTIYAIDIYSNVYKINYSFEVDEDTDNDNSTFGPFAVTKNSWKIIHIFSGNPGSNSVSGEIGKGIDSSDQGRKTFYPPAISWGGACSYFDAKNYFFTNTEFSGQGKIASLYFGTGDREHPTYTMIRNRFYAVYDDSSVTAVDNKGTADTADDTDVLVSGVPYTEDDLLNLTCDEFDLLNTIRDKLDAGSKLSTAEESVLQANLQEKLRDDAVYEKVDKTQALENKINEDDAKGWYIVLEDQGNGSCFTGYTEDHHGEKILSAVNLYSGNLYFTSYQPSISDPCNPRGNGFGYSLNYCNGSSAYNLNTGNDTGGVFRFDVSDRSTKVTNILGIPSDFAIITRKGGAGAMSMMGGNIIGPKGGSNFTINSPPKGLDLYYWFEGNSQK